MKGKIIAKSKWILLVTLSQVSGFLILQVNDIDGKLVTNLLDAVKKSQNQNEEDIKNIVSDIIAKHHATKNIDYRKSQDVKDYLHKKLVKRIVPHGYEMKDLEYDEKFKTLFKPLVRIHKRKLDSDDSGEDEDRYDLIYILDDDRFEDAALEKDDSLLKPFTTDNMDIKYLPSGNDVEYIINKDGKDLEVSNEFSEVDQSRYTLIGKADQINANNFPNRPLNFYLNDDKSKQDGNTGQWDQYIQEPANSIYINDLLNKITEFKKSKQLRIPDPKSEKPHRFVSVGQLLSKQFKPEQIIGLDETAPRSYKQKSLPNKYINNENILNLLELVQLNNQNKIQEDAKNKVQALGWFGPVGVINSKHLTKTDKFDDIDSQKVYDYEEMSSSQAENDNNLVKLLKQTIQQQIETSDEHLSIDANSVQDNLRPLIGYINSKHKNDNRERKNDPERVPIYYILPKDSRQKEDKDIGSGKKKSNKFTLLPEIAELKANNLDNERKERLNEKESSIVEELRSHLKSGEEEETALQQKHHFEYDDYTTAKPVPVKPNYSFWNEWTYDKQIVQDDCKGKLVQNGRLCIGAFA